MTLVMKQLSGSKRCKNKQGDVKHAVPRFLLKLGRKPKAQACEIHKEDGEDDGGHVWVCILFSQR